MDKCCNFLRCRVMWTEKDAEQTAAFLLTGMWVSKTNSQPWYNYWSHWWRWLVLLLERINLYTQRSAGGDQCPVPVVRRPRSTCGDPPFNGKFKVSWSTIQLRCQSSGVKSSIVGLNGAILVQLWVTNLLIFCFWELLTLRAEEFNGQIETPLLKGNPGELP